MGNEVEKKVIKGQSSFCLSTAQVELALTEQAGMLAPVTFYRDTQPVQPYEVAPWAEETDQHAGLPNLLIALRGDFMCSSFGGNEAPFEGKTLPPHGETANDLWTLTGSQKTDAGCTLTTQMDLSVRGGKCVKHVALREGENFVYLRHDFSGVNGPLNPGHHATLLYPDVEGCGRLAFSRFAYSHTYVQPTEQPTAGGYSWIKADQPVADLTQVPCIDGSTTDVTRYPARRGFEDIMIICADPALDFAWTSVTFEQEGYVWITLRDPKLLPSTLLWMSNGGRYYAPWNGRHINTMGMEDICGFFHEGLASSAQPGNLLNQKGIKTCHQLTAGQTLSIPYIQGVVRVPAGFDVVKDVALEEGAVRLTSASGVQVMAACQTDFIKSGQLAGLID